MLPPVAARRISPILHQVVFQLPAHLGQVLLPLEMGEQAVGQEQPGGAARDRAADAGQVVELAEGPGEGGLASLVGPGHDEDALAVLPGGSRW